MQGDGESVREHQRPRAAPALLIEDSPPAAAALRLKHDGEFRHKIRHLGRGTRLHHEQQRARVEILSCAQGGRAHDRPARRAQRTVAALPSPTTTPRRLCLISAKEHDGDGVALRIVHAVAAGADSVDVGIRVTKAVHVPEHRVADRDRRPRIGDLTQRSGAGVRPPGVEDPGT